MKRFVLSVLFAAGLITLAAAQTADTTQPQMGLQRPPTQRAVRQLKVLEKQLQLTEDQVLQMQVILIHKTVAMDSIRDNPSGDRKADNRARRSVQQNADAQINDMLTGQQRTLYREWKQKEREKALERKQAETQPNNP